MAQHKVFIFGSRELGALPEAIVNHIERIVEATNGDVEFIIGDAPGIDTNGQKVLAMLGLTNKSTIYCMDTPRNNVYDIPTRIFKTYFDPESKTVGVKNPENEVIGEVEGITNISDVYKSPSYYEIKDKEMCNDCTFAICFWDGKSKGTRRNVTRLQAQNKYVYVYTAQI